MNKKVLSALLFGALMAGTGTFTSCIDNDEPAGIEELRGAKAELIRAKVAVEQANAAYTLAQAEVEKAKAAKQAALAKQEEAKARKEAAIAEAQEATTAQAKAEAEKAIAAAQQEMEIALLQHQASVLEEKQALAEAQRDYEIAIKQIEIAKALMSEEQKIQISDLIQDVEDYTEDIALKQGEIDEKLAELKSASLVFELDSAFEVAKAEAALKTKKASLDANAEKIATYKKYLANDSTLDVSAWREEIAKIEGEIAEYQKQIAVFKVDSAKALNGEERKALDQAIAEANKALAAEQDTLNNMKLAGNVVDTLLWYNGVKNDMTTININAETTSADAAAKLLAGNDYANAEDSLDYANIIAGLRAEHDSYTTEYKYWLDSIASSDAAIAAGIKAESDSAIVYWERALKAYNDQDTTMASKLAAAEKAVDGKTFTNAKSMKDAAKAMLDYLTVAKKNGAVLNNVLTLDDSLKVATGFDSSKGEVVYATKASYSLQDPLTVLADTTKTYVAYVTFGQNFLASTGAAKSSTVLDKATGKDKKFEYTSNVIKTAAPTEDELHAKLVEKSDYAFGQAELYVNNDAEVVALQKDYLHLQPSKDDAKFVGYNNAGKYGTYLASLDAETQFVAKNHEAIKADLKSAIDKLTALVDGIRVDAKKAGEDVTAANKVVIAANQALTDYITKVGTDYTNATAELDAKLVYMRRLADDLGNAVKLYLEDAKIYNNYGGEALFINYLKEELTKAEANVIDLEYAVAKAEHYLQLTKEGDFTAAKKVAEVKADLALLEAEMAELVDELAEAMEALATAEEIWNAAE